MIFEVSALVLLTNCSGTNNSSKEITTKSGLKYTVIKEGQGEMAKAGEDVAIYEEMGYLHSKSFYSID